MTIEALAQTKRFTKVKLAIPALRPMKTLEGNQFESTDSFKLLGMQCGCLARLSRIGDNAKITVRAEDVIVAGA